MMDPYLMERERLVDNLARSKAMCLDKLRHHDCCAWECKSCEKQRLWNSCAEGLDDYSRLLLGDKIDVLAKRLPIENPTYEEAVEMVESERERERKVFLQAHKNANWKWWHGGGWMAIAAVVFTLIFVPIFGCMEWYL